MLSQWEYTGIFEKTYLNPIFILLLKRENEYFIGLKAVDTIGNCQRLAFTVGVSQHMHKITNL